MTPDDELLRAYATRGSVADAAFAELVRRHLDFVYASALRQTRRPERAQDVAQTVFLALARKAGGLVGRSDLRGWLFTSTHFAATALLRSEVRRQAREQRAHAMEEITREGNDAVAWDSLAPVLDDALARLSESDRNALLERFFQGKSHAEVAAAGEMTAGAARMRVDRALEKLRRVLARRGITSTGAALGAALAGQPAVAAPASLYGAAIGLAGAAAAGVTAAAATTLLSIMSTAKIAWGAAALIAALGLATALHEHALVQDREAQLNRVQTALAGTRADLRTALAREKNASSPAAHGAAFAPAGAVAHGGKDAAAAGFAALMRLMSDPHMQRQTAALASIRLDGQYGPFFAMLHLPPDQLAQFKQLLIEKEMVGFDSMSAATEQGLDPAHDPAGFFRAVAGAEQTVDAQITSLLGEQRMGEFQHYLDTVPARATANQLSQALSYTAEPLTGAQVSQVVAILARDGTPALPPGNPFAVLNGDLGVVRVSTPGMNQLQSLLTASQLQALTQAMHQHQELLAARTGMGTH